MPCIFRSCTQLSIRSLRIPRRFSFAEHAIPFRNFSLIISPQLFLLRSPQLDTHVCQTMLDKGWLDREGVSIEAFCFLESHEDLAQGDNFAEDEDEMY